MEKIKDLGKDWCNQCDTYRLFYWCWRCGVSFCGFHNNGHCPLCGEQIKADKNNKTKIGKLL